MMRLAKAEVFDRNEVAVAHVYNRTVRRCFSLADDSALSLLAFSEQRRWATSNRFTTSLNKTETQPASPKR